MFGEDAIDRDCCNAELVGWWFSYTCALNLLCKINPYGCRDTTRMEEEL